MNKVPRWVFRYVGNKTFDFSSKKKDFFPKNDQIWPKTGIFGQFGPGHAGLFGALLVGRLVVVARAVSRKTPIYFIHIFPKKWNLLWSNLTVRETGRDVDEMQKEMREKQNRPIKVQITSRPHRKREEKKQKGGTSCGARSTPKAAISWFRD